MTTAPKAGATDVVVVDGSNIATEGRSSPSLSQLNDAVMAFRDEFPDAVVTVVVDATFGHRIDKKESGDFDAAVAHNELVAPPAGAIGRGDAFVLSIANKVGARVLSNDSFQEFHGDYPWLFEEGRLIGGKPVPFVGWVFVARLPVKGPTSRKAQRAARGDAKPVRRSASKAASLPMPVPTAPPPSARRPTVAEVPVVDAVEPARPVGAPVNDLLPFLDFVEHHPIGSSVNGVVESYSSHGAYVSIGDVRGYVPLRMMSDPPPRSAREVMRVQDAVTLVVTSFAPARRNIDLAVPEMAPSADVVPTPALEELAGAVMAPKRTRGTKAATEPTASRKRVPRAQAAPDDGAAAPAADPPAATAAAPPDGQAAPAPRKRVSKRSVTEPPTEPTSTPPPAVGTEPAPAPAKRATKKTAAAAANAPAPTTKKATTKATTTTTTKKKAPATRAAGTTAKKTAKKATKKAPATAEPAQDAS